MEKLVPAAPAPELQFFATTPDLSFEDALAHASNVLRCAAVAAQTAGEQLDGTSRTLVISVMHLVEMASVMVDRSLECIQPRQLPQLDLRASKSLYNQCQNRLQNPRPNSSLHPAYWRAYICERACTLLATGGSQALLA